MDEETTIWRGTPSQLINFPVFLVCALAAGALLGVGGVLLYHHTIARAAGIAIAATALIPLAISFGKWLVVRCRRYELTTERLLLTSGVFSRDSQALELYRVKDYSLAEPLLLRLFGLGDITLATHDESNPTLTLRAVPGAQALRDDIRKHVELCRDKKRVRVAELE